jgi:preprotein translocase subunit SecG
MNWLQKIKVLAAVMFLFCFLVSASLSSCTNKGQSEDKEATEHPEGDKANEHPEGDKANEHPEKADSVQQTPQ